MTDLGEVRARVDRYLWWHYRVHLSDVTPATVPGYWDKKVACVPSECHAPIHGFMFNEGPIRHTVTYFDEEPPPGWPKGRFFSPTWSWKLITAGGAS